MRRSRHIWFFAAAWLILLGVALGFLYATNVNLVRQKVTVPPEAGQLDKTEFKNGLMMDGSDKLHSYVYEAVVRKRLFTPEQVVIRAVSCIAGVSLSGYRIRYNNCPWGGNMFMRGTLMGKSEYEIALTVRMSRYDMSNITIVADSPLRTFARTLTLVLFGIALIFVFWAAKVPKRIIAVAALGFLLSLMYLRNTPYDIRSYDIMGHIGYIRYVASHYHLPPIGAGWEFYQPPLYYAAAAIVYKLVAEIGIANPFVSLQLFSLAIYSLFLIYVYKILSFGGLLKGKFLTMAFALFVFWPSSIIHSVMIGNDVMLYLWYAVSLFYTLKCLGSGSKKDFLIAGLAAALSVFTKSNGLIMAALLYPAVAVVHGAGWYRRHWRSAIVAAGIVLLLFGLNAGRLAGASKGTDLFIANVNGLGRKFAVKNTAVHMLSFDPKAYFTDPYGDVFDDRSGRQFFFPYLWKTGLMNTEYYNMYYVEGSRLLLLLFLYLAGFALAGAVLALKKRPRKIHPTIFLLALNAILLLAASFSARLRYPYSSTGDFRYIYPFLISFVFFEGYYLQSAEEKKGILGYVLTFVIIAFMGLTAVLCLVPPY